MRCIYSRYYYVCKQFHADAGLLGKGVGHFLPHLGAVGSLDGSHLDGGGFSGSALAGGSGAAGRCGGAGARAAAGGQGQRHAGSQCQRNCFFHTVFLLLYEAGGAIPPTAGPPVDNFMILFFREREHPLC